MSQSSRGNEILATEYGACQREPLDSFLETSAALGPDIGGLC